MLVAECTIYTFAKRIHGIPTLGAISDDFLCPAEPCTAHPAISRYYPLHKARCSHVSDFDFGFGFHTQT